MEEDHVLSTEDLSDTFPHLFERLSQIPGYVWDESIKPYHSSYDNWVVYGTRTSSGNGSLPKLAYAETTRSSSPRSSPQSSARPSVSHTLSAPSDSGSEPYPASRSESGRTKLAVVARVSIHALRLERDHHLCESLLETSDPKGKHIVHPYDFVRLPSQQGDRGPIVVSIVGSPGKDDLKGLAGLRPDGPTETTFTQVGSQDGAEPKPDSPVETRISLLSFLDFAVGASECLELLHHGQRTVHGELRGDAFNFSQDTGEVKLVNFGAGPRSFENGILTSAKWSTLSREIGIKDKLQFIAPEQTGRMTTAPDSRTDIYSLGILFWTALTGEPAFDGRTPMEVVQGVLSRRLAPVSSKRFDIPDVVSAIIQKMTMKQIDERYHSASGLKYDLVTLQKILGDGDGEALKTFTIATRDVSSSFNLPTEMVGRKAEHDQIVRIIERVSKRPAADAALKGGMFSISSTASSSVEDGRADSAEMPDGSSDAASSRGADNARTGSATGQAPAVVTSDPSAHTGSYDSQVSAATIGAPSEKPSQQQNGTPTTDGKPNLQCKQSADSRTRQDRPALENESTTLGRQHSTRRARRKARCEVVSIAGAAGLGKSCLVQSVQSQARRCGYTASTKFDQAKKQPFEPVLRLMSSLFRQIFSESDVSTEFHNMIRNYVRPVWPLLHVMLDIPEHLLGNTSSPTKVSFTTPAASAYNKSLSQKLSRRGSSPASSQSSLTSSKTGGSSRNTEFLRGRTATKSLRFMNTFLDVLRLLAHQKFICLCLDDLQFADEESLELITNIVDARIKLVVIVTYRQEEMLGVKVRSVLESENANITRIELAPLSEEDIVSYVAATLYRSKEYVVPLAAVIQEKTDGNPFEIREMLSTSFRKNCLWYDWKGLCWDYSLDRIFHEFASESYGERLNNDFVIRRLNELPAAARTILAWASLLGTVFSFSLVQKLMSSEFDYESDDDQKICPGRGPDNVRPADETVAGLHAALQACVLIPGEEDDQFRFAHDRYMQAAVSLRECRNVAKMHFLIAQTLMKYNGLDDQDIYVRSRHVCQSVDIIKKRVVHRSRFRELLLRAAQKAIESGARPSALYYYQNCVEMLQPDPWGSGPDVYYEETLQLLTRLSECLWLTGHIPEALSALQTTLDKARSAIDRAPSWVLQSRIFAQSGNASGAFAALKASLKQLGLEVQDEVTWEDCDDEFKRLCAQLEGMDRQELLKRPLKEDPTLSAMGTILVETVSAAFWSNGLLFYQIAMKMVALHLDGGTFVQVGLGYLYLGIFAVSRFNRVRLGLELSDIFFLLKDSLRDAYSLGRGHTTYWLTLGHLQRHMRDSLPQLEAVLESSVMAGDRMLSVLNLSAIALSKLFVSQDMAELEWFCTYAPEEIRESRADFRGGTILTSVRQVARALQGKTRTESGMAVLSDEHHDSLTYINRIIGHDSSPERAVDLYNSIAMVPLYLYEHYDAALTVSNAAIKSVDELWTLRVTRLLRFYLSLTILALCRRDRSSSTRSADLARVRVYKQEIEDWAVVEPVNYEMWSKLLEAELWDATEDFGFAVAAYEASLDHSEAHGFVLEAAMTCELMAGFYVRRGSRRAARTFVTDAVSSYRRISAYGKASQVARKYERLVRDSANSRTTDVACQTDLGANAVQMLEVDENERRMARNRGERNSEDRTRDWLGPGPSVDDKMERDTGLSGHGIDVIDLQSILTSSQIISSELDEKVLLPKMCELILGGNSADFAAIIVEEDDIGWGVAASGDHTNEVKGFDPYLPMAEAEVEDQVSKQIALYCLRSREAVFLQNLLSDERFSNVSDRYLMRNPLGKSVIAIPILHGGDSLLGALYMEGPPNSFTDRNLTVLQLLVNQMGISISNARLFKKLRKVSASNVSMIESQRRALAQARAAEAKAKKAEADAIHNLHLKEEAAKAKSIFLANVSHELRTPLNGVIGMSELLKATPMTRDQGEYADSIRVCADTLLTVINDILDYSKLEAGKMQLVAVPFDLQEAIQEVVRALACTHQEKDLKTVERLKLPSTLVVGDPVRIHQILMNLLSNSYKFTPAGSVTVHAEVEHESKNSIRIRCSVGDTGIGISAEQLKRLFMPFSQADSSTARRYGGSGLGLSICKSLISAMDGNIWIESDRGIGTTVHFTLTLPKAPKDAAAVSNQIAARVPEPSSAPSTPARVVVAQSTRPHIDLSQIPRHKLRICIAEDNPINQKIAIAFVQRLGFHVDAYENGRQAVEALQAMADAGRPYHLVLMDVQMPELDGYDATRLLRLDPRPAVREVLVVAMTASAIQGDRERCLDAGMNNYLAKPVRANVLKTMLESYLQQPDKAMPNLQQTAHELATSAMQSAPSRGEDHHVNGIEPDTGDVTRPRSAAPNLPHHQRHHSLLRRSTARKQSPPKDG